VIGKGDKERLVPIGNTALKFIAIYRDQVRVHVEIKKGNERYFIPEPQGSQAFAPNDIHIAKKSGAESGIKRLYLPILSGILLPHTW
jgi:integrase/recombinase XerD